MVIIKKAGITSTFLDGWAITMQIKINFLCRDSILAAPIVLDLALFLDLAKRAGMSGIQEWLSFYFKSPQTLPGLAPEHDIFKQLMKLENTLRHLMGEDLITHLDWIITSNSLRPDEIQVEQVYRNFWWRWLFTFSARNVGSIDSRHNILLYQS